MMAHETYYMSRLPVKVQASHSDTCSGRVGGLKRQVEERSVPDALQREEMKQKMLFFFFLKELDKRCAVPCLKVISHRPPRFTPPVILIQRVNSMGPCETYWANVMLLLENGGWALGFIDTGLI